jgi:hypothetical protein
MNAYTLPANRSSVLVPPGLFSYLQQAVYCLQFSLHFHGLLLADFISVNTLLDCASFRHIVLDILLVSITSVRDK